MGKAGNDLMRILSIATFVVSGYASIEGRQCKLFNPLLGETYEADYSDKGLHFFSEKLDPGGVLTLQFEDGETFQWSKVTTSICNIILGKIYCDHYAVCQLDWPKERLLIQVLDDSDDESIRWLIQGEVSKWMQKGVNIVYRH
ncbi:hypothetical protein L6452_34795 [Arctium lappa]|uniref:Uncharacterized protein n=1 Tax=Arctium lappa TaxID=4217 RepID=A0ACB8YJ57_ARCLA|nr:hypothetical protein L6452_34795 [Arctium lappa]